MPATHSCQTSRCGPGRRVHFLLGVLAVALTLLPGQALGAPHIGYLYKIEGFLNGQRVVYVGSAASLKVRLDKQHTWAQLLGQKSTKVSYKVSESEFRELAAEAKALWGTTDRAGDFVPGLFMPSLEVVVERA